MVHSATKYLGGHNDLLAGAASSAAATWWRPSATFQGMLGAVPDPTSCYLLARGLKTFALRLRAAERERAEDRRVPRGRIRRVERVHYPGLPSHPDHEVARRQMTRLRGRGELRAGGGLADCSRFVDALRIPQIAPSLGGVESLVEQPSLMSFYELTPEERAKIGIKDNLVRFAVGVEDTDDLVRDLEQALSHL